MSFWSNPEKSTKAAFEKTIKGVLRADKSLVTFEEPLAEELAALKNLSTDPETLNAQREENFTRLRASGMNEAAAAAAAFRIYNQGLLGRAVISGDAASRLENIKRDYGQKAALIPSRDDASAFFGG